MATNVHVTSVDALGVFRSDLIVFRAAALRVLEEVASDVSRTRQWIRHEQRLHWEGEVRRRQKKLDQALQDLMGARMSTLRDDVSQVNAVTKARHAFHEAEEKLRAVKKWDRNYDLAVDPIVKQMGSLRAVLEHDMPNALAFLANAQEALDAYSEKMGTAEPSVAAETEPEPEET
jgi:predicted HNH restriction endonuclease